MSSKRSLLPQKPRFIGIDGKNLGSNLLDKIPVTEAISTILATISSGIAYQATNGGGISNALVHAGLTGVFCVAAMQSPSFKDVLKDEFSLCFGDNWHNRAIDKNGTSLNTPADTNGATHAAITFKVSALLYSTAGAGAMYLDHFLKGTELGGSPFGACAAVGNAALATASLLIVTGLRFGNVAKNEWSVIDADTALDQLERDRIRNEKTRLNSNWSAQPAAIPIPIHK